MKITISLEIKTDKSNDEVINALKRGIYRGLDTEPYYISQPKDVNILNIKFEESPDYSIINGLL